LKNFLTNQYVTIVKKRICNHNLKKFSCTHLLITWTNFIMNINIMNIKKFWRFIY